MDRKKVIIAGGGFAGIQFIEHLDKDLFDVLLIDKLNHHQFQPLFYQVATSQLEPGNISFPFRKIFQGRRNIQIRMAEVLSVDPLSNSITTSIGNFSYDYLVLATGCRTNFFGNDHLEKYTFSLKTTYDAIRIRNTILQSFEDLLSIDESEKEYLLNIVIVGAGPTGVELAGAFAEIKKNILPRDYPNIDLGNLQVILLEGSGHTLNSMSDSSKKMSEKYLRSMGVAVKTGILVKDYDGNTISLSNGETIRTRRVIWAAGVTGNIPKGFVEKVVVMNGRIVVDRHNLVKGCSNIFALGDLAYMETPAYPKGHPQLANVAIHQARNLARNLKFILKNKPLRDYEYRNLGAMATVGKNKAVVDLPFIRFHGYFAWFIWMFLHLMLILSIRNKLVIFINWAFNYLTKDTSLRLILQEKKR